MTRSDAVWLFVVLAGGSAWCWSAADRVGLTYDEPVYLIEGRNGWRDGTSAHLMKHGTMPLPIDVQSVLSAHRSNAPFDPPTEYILSEHVTARRANLVFWGILIVHVWLLGRHLAGPWAGRIACGLVAADLNVLGHAALATTDVALAATVVAGVYHTAVCRRGRVVDLIVPGLVYGFAVLAKVSGVVYGGLAIVVIEVWHRIQTPRTERTPWTRWLLTATGRTVCRSLIAMSLVVGYCGWDPEPERTKANARHFVRNDPTAFGRLVHRHAAKLPNALVAVVFQYEQNRTGRGTFLLGRWHDEAVWYFFPAALAVKFPDVGWLLLGVVLVRRPRSLVNLPMVLAVVWLLSVLPGTIQLGIRLILPVFVLLHVGLAVALMNAWPKAGRWIGLAAVGGGFLIAAWQWPHGLLYANTPSGGPTRTHKRLSDSNADWGQGIPDLARWHAANNSPALAVWYFGSDPRAHTPAFAHVNLSELTPQEAKARLGPTLLAVGHTVVSNDPTPKKAVVLEWLGRLWPVAKLPTFTIYDLRNAD